MKQIHLIAGLLIIGLLAQNGLAAKTKSRNGRTQRQAYLPPRAPNGPHIHEEYITIHEEHAPSGHTPFQESNYGGGKYQVFEIHSHYEPSEEPVSSHSSGGFSGPDYLPPPEQEIRVEHIHHVQEAHHGGGHQYVVTHATAPASPVAHAPSFQSSYQQENAHHGGGSAAQDEVIRVEHFHVSQLQHNEQQNGFKAPDYLPPLEGNSPPHSAPQEYHAQDYLPPHVQIDFPPQSTQQFRRTPNYLPPHQEHHHEKVQQHVEQHQAQHQEHHQSQQIKGPDYLPPYQHQQQTQQQHHHHHHQSQQQIPQQHSAFKGPDYLPPHQNVQTHQHNQHEQGHQQAFKAPDYLPPHQTQTEHSHYHAVAHQQAHRQIQVQQQHNFKAPDYLPPHQQSHQHEVQHHQQVPQQPNSFKGPDYLPPHTHETQQSHQYGGQQQTHQQPNPVKGREYLPPHQSQAQHSHQQQTHQQSTQFRAPDYLPPHQEHQQHINPGNNARQPGSLPSGYEPQIPAVPAPEPVAQPQPAFQHPLLQPAPPPPPAVVSDLPAGYDFEKPENSEQAIAELHTLPEEDVGHQNVVVQSQIQVAQGPQQGGIIYGSGQAQAPQSNYLPPHQSSNNYQSSAVATQQQSALQYQQTLQQVAPQTFEPPTAAPVAQAQPASIYLPSATPVQAHQYGSALHSLSSYMSSVEPTQRYATIPGPRQPFREYGPPPNSAAVPQQQQQQPQPLPSPIAPMYREPASRPPHYAPTMSYATNAVAHSHAVNHNTKSHQQQHQQVSFNQQTRQNLQQFMPSEITRLSPVAAAAPAPAPAPVSAPAPIQPAALYSAPAVPARESSSSKIRTVQILNPARVKTLKVLETSDHAGVKTIKILGQSNSEPHGDHQVVKVVTQNAPNAHDHVQTLKIFNDHEEVPNYSGGGRVAGGAVGNAYLPPSVRVERHSQPLKLLSDRRSFTGRRRYRF